MGKYDLVNIARIEVFVGALLAAMIVYLFSAWAIKAVGKTAGKIIEEVRRQFRADPGIMLGTSKPDYAKAVDITARAGLREMVVPGLMPVLAPVMAPVIIPASAPFRVIPRQNTDRITTGPKAAPKPAQA